MQKLILVITFLIGFYSYSQTTDPLATKDAAQQQIWVDSVYNSLSLKEKFGQLFMLDVWSEKEKAHTNRIKKLIEEYSLGGVIFSRGGPQRQAKITNEYQAMSKVPMLVAMDAEWGLAMRLDSTHAFPWNMTLGAIEDNTLVENIGYRMGKHAKRLGVHINFAPVLDINTNPKNPIIGNRSFGEDKDNVTQKAVAIMQGLQRAGVLANGKHFPGHGDTAQDSHKTLPTINFTEERIDSVELYPYKYLFQEGLASVMVAHLNVPSLEYRDGYPSSISKNIVTTILKERLGFKGLIFTDALNMKGASNFSAPGDIDLAAFLAGNDILLISEDVPKAVTKLTDAFNAGLITEERLSHSVKKILKAKYKVGLHNCTSVDTLNLVDDLNTLEDNILTNTAFEKAITLVKNDENLVPFRDLDKKRIAYIHFGDDDGAPFLKMLKRYTSVTEIKSESLVDVLNLLKNFNTVIIGHHRSNDSPWKAHKFTNKELVWLNEISRNHKVVLDIFVKPYALLDVPSFTNVESVVVSYQNSIEAQEKSAQVLFGAIGASGKLPVTAHDEFPEGTGITTNAISRLGYSIPETVNMSSLALQKIDSVVNFAIKNEEMPGAQILVARRGKVIYNKSFGKPTYTSKYKIQEENIYDLASLTKILATLPMVMRMEEEGKLSLQSTIGELLPDLKKSNKNNILLLDILSHYGRLKPWIPFYINTLDNISKQPASKYYSRKFSPKYSVRVTNRLFMRKDYIDSMYTKIVDSDLLTRKRYRYSDLPYYLLKKYIEGFYDKSLNTLTQENFYKSLGANYTTYLPLEKFPRSQIIPSEKDTYFRYQTIQGYVHDMGAAMQGGVGGHAGLFSTANDVAKIMQLYLQKGFYGGKRYFKTETISKFNKCYFCEESVRRGVGFDKPQLDEEGPTCGCVSMESFGHSGFTGTYTWADPEQEIVYVFLSNRTYPTMENRKLIENSTRTVIQQLIYDSIQDKIENLVEKS
jgi:beta-glucosidase-like glycosyl hydrolase/CubicO group peptidase (beta-lactamase class C family)